MKRGFTLIEVMVAAVVLAIGALGILAMLLTTINNNKIAHDRTVAVTLAEQQLAEIEALASNWSDTTDSHASNNLLKALLSHVPEQTDTAASGWYGIQVGSDKSRALTSSKENFTPLNVNGTVVPSGSSGTNAPPPGRFYVGFSMLPESSQFPKDRFVRGAIRVAWDRSGATNTACSDFAKFDEIDKAPAACEFVTLPFAFHKT